MKRSSPAALPRRANDDWTPETFRIRQANPACRASGSGIFVFRKAPEVLRTDRAISQRAVRGFSQRVWRRKHVPGERRFAYGIESDGSAPEISEFSGAGRSERTAAACRSRKGIVSGRIRFMD